MSSILNKTSPKTKQPRTTKEEIEADKAQWVKAALSAGRPSLDRKVMFRNEEIDITVELSTTAQDSRLLAISKKWVDDKFADSSEQHRQDLFQNRLGAAKVFECIKTRDENGKLRFAFGSIDEIWENLTTEEVAMFISVINDVSIYFGEKWGVSDIVDNFDLFCQRLATVAEQDAFLALRSLDLLAWVTLIQELAKEYIAISHLKTLPAYTELLTQSKRDQGYLSSIDPPSSTQKEAVQKAVENARVMNKEKTLPQLKNKALSDDEMLLMIDKFNG